MKGIRIIASLLALTMVLVPADARRKKASAEPEIKYVFYMIGDGMGINQVYGAQYYNQATGYGPETINFTQFPVRTFVTTHSASDHVTDSAASGTALSTGNKTYNGAIGVDADGNPVLSVADWAKAEGWGTGVATSVAINHATPSAFYAHVKSRRNYEEITACLVEGALDFAAGADFLEEKRKTGNGVDWHEKKVLDAGITLLKGADNFKDIDEVEGRLVCLGDGESSLTYALDRRGDETKLGDFVKTGIDYLSDRYEDEGFFFMIEGGEIDYAAHSEDAVATFTELNDFASAVDIVLDFYNEHPTETLVIVTTDHDTGGLILGAGGDEMHPERLAFQKFSETELTAMFQKEYKDNAPTWEEVQSFLSEHLGLWSKVKVSKSFEESLKSTVEAIAKGDGSEGVKNLYSVNSKILFDAVIYLNKTAGYSWSHSSHSASPVGLYVLGPKAEEFNACKDNTDIPKMIAKVAGFTN